MVPIRHCLLLFWLGWGVAAGAQEERVQVVRVTESDTVTLPCVLGGLGPTPSSNSLNLTWLGPLGTMVLNVLANYRYPGLLASPRMDWGLLIHNISRQGFMDVTCSWEGNPDEEVQVSDYPSSMAYGDRNTEDMENYMNYISSGDQVFRDFTQDGETFHCNDSEVGGWAWTAVSWNPHNATEVELSMRIWQAAPYRLRVYPDIISLQLPSATSRDAGNYSCYWKNQSQHFRLEVSARSTVWLCFGKQHWIIWSVALGCVAVCLGFLFGFLRFKRAFRARRQKKKMRAPGMRKVFHAQRNRAPVSGGILLPLVNGDGKEQVDALSYENVLPDMSPRGGQQSLQKGNTLPPATKVEEENDEEYECPDSETEQKSDNEDNYENTQEEVKQEDVVLNDGSPYENRGKESCVSITGANSWYANNSQKGLRDLAQDPVSEDGDNYENVEEETVLSPSAACLIADGDNYENVEEETVLSPGAARLIAGLRLKLALDPPMDKQDGGSEASTGSQTYEEMNGTLSPTPSKSLHTSNEEDADSYENMESPNSFSLRKESDLDPQGEGAAFGSVRQNLSISFGADL